MYKKLTYHLKRAKKKFLLIENLLNRIQNVEESDTTGADSSNAVHYIILQLRSQEDYKLKTTNYKLILLRHFLCILCNLQCFNKIFKLAIKHSGQIIRS